MSEWLSPEHERYVESVLSDGTFGTRREVLDEGVRLLKWREQFLDRLIDGRPACDGEGFRELFDEIHILGRTRHDGGRGLK